MMPLLRLVGNSALSLMAKASSGYWNVMDPTTATRPSMRSLPGSRAGKAG